MDRSDPLRVDFKGGGRLLRFFRSCSEKLCSKIDGLIIKQSNGEKLEKKIYCSKLSDMNRAVYKTID